MTTALQVHQPPQAPANALPSSQEWQTLMSMASTLVKSGMLPDTVKTPEAAAAIMLKGRELDIPAMQSFSQIAVIKGKPTCSAELMLALLGRGGVTWTWVEDGQSGTARIRFRRPGFGDCEGSFSLEQAKAAGVMSNPVWKSYPANMLRARAITNGARMIGPDLLSGMTYTPEELGAAVNEDGEPVETATQIKTVELPKKSPFKTVALADENNHIVPVNEDGEPVPQPYGEYLAAAKEKAAQLGLARYKEVLKTFDLDSAKDIDAEDVASQEALIAALVAALDGDAALMDE